MTSGQGRHFAAVPALERLGLPRPPRLPRAGEVAAVALGAILVALLFVPHILGGALYNDDWQYLDNYRFAPDPGFFGAVANFDESSFRPGQMVYWPVKFGL